MDRLLPVHRLGQTCLDKLGGDLLAHLGVHLGVMVVEPLCLYDNLGHLGLLDLLQHLVFLLALRKILQEDLHLQVDLLNLIGDHSIHRIIVHGGGGCSLRLVEVAILLLATDDTAALLPLQGGTGATRHGCCLGRLGSGRVGKLGVLALDR